MYLGVSEVSAAANCALFRAKPHKRLKLQLNRLISTRERERESGQGVHRKGYPVTRFKFKLRTTKCLNG